MNNYKLKTRQRAYASIPIVISLLATFVLVGGLLSSLSYQNYLDTQLNIEATQAKLLADSAAEEALLRLNRDPELANLDLNTEFGQATVVVSDTSGSEKTINVNGEIQIS